MAASLQEAHRCHGYPRFSQVAPVFFPGCSHVSTILGCYNGLCAQPIRCNSTVPEHHWYITLWKGKRL